MQKQPPQIESQPSGSPLSLLWTFLIDRFKVTILLVLFILFYGLTSYRDIARETTPEIDIPAAVITTVWPGATPGDVENLITNKIEKEIKDLDNLEEYTSVSRSGVSVISIEFDIDSDKSENLQKLREELDQAENELPDSIPDDPDLQEVSITDIPIVSYTLSGDFSWSELKQFAEIIEDELDTIPKVKDVAVNGEPEDQMHIILDPIKMQAKGISVSEVVDAVRAHHIDLPLGQVSVSGQMVEVTVQAEMDLAQEFMQVPVMSRDGIVVRLGDFAEVRREFDKFEVETYFTTEEKNSQPSVAIDVIKSGSKGNVIKMVAESEARIAGLRAEQRIPDGLDVTVTYSRADDINKDLSTLTTSGWQTLVLIAIVMFLALGWRESLLAAVAIPLSMLIAITTLFIQGMSFNGVSLFALVLSVGLLVDNAIIIVEGLSSGINDKRLKPREAAIWTLKTFRWPIITGTLTTIFAFLPMLFFISGVSGQYVRVIPITVTAGLLGALFVSLFLMPALGVKFFQAIPPDSHRQSRTLANIQAWYERRMKSILSSRLQIAIVLLITFVTFVFSLSLLVTRKVPVEVFPAADQLFFAAKAELPVGSRLEETRKLLEPIEDTLREYFEPRPDTGEVWLKNLVFTVGRPSGAVQGAGGGGITLSEEHVLGITINLTDKEVRETPSYAIVPLIRAKLETALPPFVDVEMSEQEGGPPTGAPIELRISGNDLDHLGSLADQLTAFLEGLDGTVDVRDSRSDPVTQLTWEFDRDVLTRFGLAPTRIISDLRAAVNGVTVVEITEGDEEIDVDLRIDWEGDKRWDDPSSLDYLDRIPIKTPSGQFITLGQVAQPRLSSELSKIEHRDGERTIYVRSDVRRGMVPSQLEPQVKAAIADLEVLPGHNIEIGGENEEGNRLINEMGRAMSAALLLIFLVLVWQFNSYTQPFVILLLIPLSLTAVFIGFWLGQMTVTFPTMIGIVSLAGIIVNDAIVLIDRMNQNFKKTGDKILAYIHAGQERMQPIFLTSVTTVVGMLPLSLSDELWGGLGFAIVYGMLLSTVLTLLLTPCFLMVFNGIGNMCKRGQCWIMGKD